MQISTGRRGYVENQRMLRAAALTLALCLLLTGCSFPMQETIQVEELLRAPRLAG